MKYFDAIKFSNNKLWRNKKNYFFIVIYIICTIIMLFGLIFRDNFANYIYSTVTKNIGFRSLLVSADLNSEDLGLSKLESIDHVMGVYSSNYDYAIVESEYKNDIYDGYLELQYGNEITLPINIIGNRLNEDSTGVAICPIEFYPSSKSANLEIDEDKIIDGHDILNSSFEITYYSYYFEDNKLKEKDKFNKQFKVIGLYDNREVITANNTCYVSAKDLIEISQTTSINNDSSAYGFVVVVDIKDNVEKVMNELNALGFEPSIKNEVDTSIANIILLSCNILITVVMLTTIILTIYFIKKKLIDKRKEIALLRSIGYDKNQIIIFNSFEIFITHLTTYLLGLFITLIIIYILRLTLLKKLIYSGFELKFFGIDFLFVFIIIVIILPNINIFYILKTSKKSIHELIGGEK